MWGLLCSRRLGLNAKCCLVSMGCWALGVYHPLSSSIYMLHYWPKFWTENLFLYNDFSFRFVSILFVLGPPVCSIMIKCFLNSLILCFFSISFLFFLRCLQYPHLLIFGLEPLVANCDRTSFWSPSFPPAGLQTNTRMSGISLHENTFLQNSTGSWHDRTHHMPAPSCTTRLLEICSLSSFQHIPSYLSHYVKPRNCRKLC